jgi:hypothetical protein
MAFELTPEARLGVTLDCDNGGARRHWVGGSPWGPAGQTGSGSAPLACAPFPTLWTALPNPPPPPPTAGLTKRYRLDVVDADILHASVDRDACPTAAVAEAAELNK